MKTALFCDFDGTISQRDVGYNIFHHFSHGRNDELLPDWKEGRLSTRDCLRLEAEMVNASAEEIYTFIDQFEIDRAFHDFIRLRDKNNAPLFIVSDGLDFYIKYILKKNNLDHLDVVSNKGILENNGITIQFPHKNISCNRCGICKGEKIEAFLSNTNEKYQTIFVGDGYSDACATRVADFIFAKKDLEEYCQKNNINYYSYITFDDVINQIIKMGLMSPI